MCRMGSGIEYRGLGAVAATALYATRAGAPRAWAARAIHLKSGSSGVTQIRQGIASPLSASRLPALELAIDDGEGRLRITAHRRQIREKYTCPDLKKKLET